mmetsp:Transcript_110922/g.324472  ORF Transcript_110922/g.324472 Transcript_110922/m.324472 type:complete len:215 (+) Transcript_110922:75-719(+)
MEGGSDDSAKKLAASEASAHAGSTSRGDTLAVVFFDFDSTLTIPQYIQRARKYALADNPPLFAAMSEEEVFANFGGRERVERLAMMLQRLQQKGVELFIVSLGFTQAIQAHLSKVGLAGFFPADSVYGQDSPMLAAVHHRKAWLITRLLERHGWPPERALFVDDDDRHISLCKKLQACPCLKVHGHGLIEAEMQTIEAHAGACLPPEKQCCSVD